MPGAAAGLLWMKVRAVLKLMDPSGRLRLLAYILIALVIAVAAILLVTAGLLLAPS